MPPRKPEIKLALKNARPPMRIPRTANIDAPTPSNCFLSPSVFPVIALIMLAIKINGCIKNSTTFTSFATPLIKNVIIGTSTFIADSTTGNNTLPSSVISLLKAAVPFLLLRFLLVVA